MRHTLFSNRLENMFSQLNSYTSNTNMRILQKDLRHIGHELDVEYDKVSKPSTSNIKSRRLLSQGTKTSKQLKPKTSSTNVDSMAEDIIEKLKKRDKEKQMAILQPESERSVGMRTSMGSTFYKSVKKKPKPQTSSGIIDSKNTTVKSFMLNSKSNLGDTHLGSTIQNTDEGIKSPRPGTLVHTKEQLNDLLKTKLINISRDIDMKPIKFKLQPSNGPMTKVVEFKSNSAKNEYLIRDYTMGLNSTENSKKNMSITETFYDRIKKKKQKEMKNDMKMFYREKYGENIITDNSLSSFQDSEDGKNDEDYEKFNAKIKKYQKVIFKNNFLGKNKRKVQKYSLLH
jgi:hypothetical protein